MKIAIIGGGISGLTTAYHLTNQNFSVSVFEKESRLGGLASSLILNGKPIERYYHFICLNDKNYINLLKDLSLQSKLHWVHTQMGLYYRGKIHPFSTPLDLFRFDGFHFFQKLRFGWGILHTKTTKNWQRLENVPVNQWLIQKFGKKSYEIVHSPLVRLKFGKYAEKLSAAWMWARIHRLGKSRTKLTQKENLGYLDGGTETLIDKLAEKIKTGGGKIFLDAEVKHIKITNRKTDGVVVNQKEYKFDYVVSTIPLIKFTQITPGLPETFQNKIKQIKFIDVICMFMQLKHSISPYFWINISDPGVHLAGIIEYSNLNPLPYLNGNKIIYLPQYLTADDKKYHMSEKELLKEYCTYLFQINPNFEQSWIKKFALFKDQHSQPICDLNFSNHTPGHRTPIEHLFITDSSQLHPDDRTISNSIGLGNTVAKLILDETAGNGFEKKNEMSR